MDYIITRYYLLDKNDKEFWLAHLKKKKMKQNELAKALKISPTYLSDILNGRRKISHEKLLEAYKILEIVYARVDRWVY